MDPHIASLSQDLKLVLRQLMSDLASEWKVMYELNSDVKEICCRAILSRVKDLCDDIRTGEIMKKTAMMKEIEECLSEKSQLHKELGVVMNLHYQDGDPLHPSVERLNSDLQKFRRMKEDRLSEWESLSSKESLLCDRLRESRTNLKSLVPSREELHGLEQRIHQLMMTKIDRERVVKCYRDRIIDMMERLEVRPLESFEKEVCDNPESIPLTEETTKKMEEVINFYENRIKEAQDRVDELECQLNRLWTQINYPKHSQDEFKRTCLGIGSSAVATLSREVERCKIYKQANIKPIILSIRRNIEHLWDQLTYTEEQRKAFRDFHRNDFNNDLLEVHEIELARLQDFYGKHEHIFTLAHRRDTLYQRLSVLGASAKDPNRYKNRGGQLLKEEKERRCAVMNLSKTTAQLKDALLEYYRQTGKPFLRHGQDMLAALEENTIPAPPFEPRKDGAQPPHVEWTECEDAASSPGKRAKIEFVRTPKTALAQVNTRIPQQRRL